MANNRGKYSRNRQLWRKYYGPKRRKPETTSFVDPVTQTSVSLDLHRTVRHRDYFIIRSHITGAIGISASLGFAEFDEGLIFVSNATTATGSFNFCFSDTPDAVVIAVEPTGDNSDFVNPYGLSFTSCSLSFGLSAPFSGSIHYRAVYSADGYPAFASSSFAPSSGTFRVVAGATNPIDVSNNTVYQIPHTGLGGIPTAVFNTSWNDNDACDIDVRLTKRPSTATNTTGDISAPLSNPVYFIAIR